MKLITKQIMNDVADEVVELGNKVYSGLPVKRIMLNNKRALLSGSTS